MISKSKSLTLKFAQTAEDIKAAQRLRYRVFVEEFGSDGDMVDHDLKLECDVYDAHYLHFMLTDTERSKDPLEQCVAVYRLLPGDKRSAVGAFYSEGEYDLTKLLTSNKKILELGRSCVHPDYRGGPALFMMWAGLARYVIEEDFDVLFGTASFHGLDLKQHAQALSWLHHNHLAPVNIRPKVRAPGAQPMDILPPDQLDRKNAMLSMPNLIKSYLRLGGVVGEGAWVDQDFNTVDVMLMVETSKVSERQRAMLTKEVNG